MSIIGWLKRLLFSRRVTLTTIDEHLVCRQPIVVKIEPLDSGGYVAASDMPELDYQWGIGDTPEDALTDYRSAIWEYYKIRKKQAERGGTALAYFEATIGRVLCESELCHPDPIGRLLPPPTSKGGDRW